MGKFWMGDDDVYAWGDRLAKQFMGLANKEGVAYGGAAGESMRAALHENARDFLSLDPQKILDEWDRMARAAKDVCAARIASGESNLVAAISSPAHSGEGSKPSTSADGR